VTLDDRSRQVFLNVIQDHYHRHLSETIDPEDHAFFKSNKTFVTSYSDLNYMSSEDILSFLKGSSVWKSKEWDICNYSDYSLRESFNTPEIQGVLMHYFLSEYLDDASFDMKHFLRCRAGFSTIFCTGAMRLWLDHFPESCGMKGHSQCCSNPEHCLYERKNKMFDTSSKIIQDCKKVFDWCQENDISFDCERLCVEWTCHLENFGTYGKPLVIPDELYRFVTLPKRYIDMTNLKKVILNDSMDKDIRSVLLDRLLK